MEIREILDKESWENFLKQIDKKSFLNSWEWGEFRELMGSKIWRLGVFEKESIISGLALVVKVISKRGSFLLLTHSPSSKSPLINEAIIKEVIDIAKKEKVDYVRIYPIWEKDSKSNLIFEKFKFKTSSCRIFHERSLELNIQRDEKTILSGMKKNTRYLIRKAQNIEDLKIIFSQKEEDLEKFYKLQRKTSLRQKFTPFSLNYLKNELKVFTKNDQIDILLAFYKEELLAGGIIIYWQNTAYYHHGASIPSNVPASYLLQWEAIRRAKGKGCSKYDFWAIAPSDDKNHPWRGLSLFKKGFGGNEIYYAKTQDKILTSKYWLTWLLEKLSK